MSGFKDIDDFWTDYENSLSQLYNWERENTKLQSQIQLDLLRLNTMKLNDTAKSRERERTMLKIQSLRELYSSLSSHLNNIEQILETNSIDQDQMEKLNASVQALSKNLKPTKSNPNNPMNILMNII